MQVNDGVNSQSCRPGHGRRRAYKILLLPLAIFFSFGNMGKFAFQSKSKENESVLAWVYSFTSNVEHTHGKFAMPTENTTKQGVAAIQVRSLSNETLLNAPSPPSSAPVSSTLANSQISQRIGSKMPLVDPKDSKNASVYERHANTLANEGENATILDIISVGMLDKEAYQDAQERTFGSHESVRNFFRLTERNDTDSACHTDLTQSELDKVVAFCKETEGQSIVSNAMRSRLYSPKHHTGWLCAQKRPIDGLYATLQRYQSGETLPSYLFIVDDDSYLKVPEILNILASNYKNTEPHILTGCRYNWPPRIHFKFPYGGFGSILSKNAIQNLLRPIYCDPEAQDGFTRHACWRLQQNTVGEKPFFREGMNVGDLMYQYSSGLPYTRLDQWINGTGYCFHSDHTFGYFFGFYSIGIPEQRLNAVEPNDILRREFGYSNIKGIEGQCKNEKKKCRKSSQMCHYIEPQQMDDMYAEEERSRIQVWADNTK